MEGENHYFASIRVIIDSGKNYQWLGTLWWVTEYSLTFKVFSYKLLFSYKGKNSNWPFEKLAVMTLAKCSKRTSQWRGRDNSYLLISTERAQPHSQGTVLVAQPEFHHEKKIRQTETEGHSSKYLACMLQKCPCHERPRKAEECSRLKGTKEAWELNATWTPRLDPGSEKATLWKTSWGQLVKF